MNLHEHANSFDFVEDGWGGASSPLSLYLSTFLAES